MYSGGKLLTRLKSDDIQSISSQLNDYNQELQIKTGRSLLGIACLSCNVRESIIMNRVNSFSFQVVPITTGQGIISNFSAVVCSILQFLGFKAEVAEDSDITGLASAFRKGADGIMMADDHRFVGINLRTNSVTDNSEATGRIFSAALDLMAGGIKGNKVLVLGCGPVGEAAAQSLLAFGARVILHDINIIAAGNVKEKLTDYGDITIVESIENSVVNYQYILEATPATNSIPDELLSDNSCVVAPGVPLGLSSKGCEILNNRLVHDKLELGVAAMAVSLLCSTNPGDNLD